MRIDGINDGLQRREVVKGEIVLFLSHNKKMTARFSKHLYKKYGYGFQATARLVSEVKNGN